MEAIKNIPFCGMELCTKAIKIKSASTIKAAFSLQKRAAKKEAQATLRSAANCFAIHAKRNGEKGISPSAEGEEGYAPSTGGTLRSKFPAALPPKNILKKFYQNFY